MSFEDFMANFDELQTCHLSPDSISRALGGVSTAPNFEEKDAWHLFLKHAFKCSKNGQFTEEERMERCVSSWSVDRGR